MSPRADLIRAAHIRVVRRQTLQAVESELRPAEVEAQRADREAMAVYERELEEQEN